MPAHYQYSFSVFARMTDILLDQAGVKEFTRVGHSMELKTDEKKIRDYQKAAYYDGNWKEESGPMLIPAIDWINGQRDKTAPTKAWASPENQKIMENYLKLGQDVIKMIPRGKLIPMKGLGDVPFVEDFQGP
jgi:hypothetical protein